MNKTFVLDTNVLLHNAECIESFTDNTVVLPMAVMEELDSFKGHNDELGRNARQVIRRIDALRAKGNLRDGVPLNKGGKLQILTRSTTTDDSGLENEIADNRILRVAFDLHKKGEVVIFVSKDINARLKADALGLQAVDFEKQKINFDELYTGFTEVLVPGSLIDELLQEKILEGQEIGDFPNEFVRLTDKSNENYSILAQVSGPGTLKALPSKHERVWSIQARNKEQRMALELLLDPEIMIVTLVGRAGTGKTLLAMAAGLQMVLRKKQYDQMLVSRPIIPLGKDIGFLPGDKDEKLSHWMQPIFDNLSYLLRDDAVSNPEKPKKRDRDAPQNRIDKLLRENTIVLEALTYIRGRSIAGQYVVIDEAQNLTPHEIKTIVSRAGEGTKMVLTGDPYQIDNPYLDSSSNGLTYAAERLKDQSIHGHITLVNSERSILAAIAADML
ncbi:MAG: PhoH family protein [Lentisphaerae bacterium]|nr:PhoH family protein [Lentisphaerota bacterium]